MHSRSAKGGERAYEGRRRKDQNLHHCRHFVASAPNWTNGIEIHLFANEARRQALLIAKFDNLGKGTSGAAVNLILMLGR
jgi:N-acetyl-gamma-glutamylphosphate reductase